MLLITRLYIKLLEMLICYVYRGCQILWKVSIKSMHTGRCLFSQFQPSLAWLMKQWRHGAHYHVSVSDGVFSLHPECLVCSHHGLTAATEPTAGILLSCQLPAHHDHYRTLWSRLTFQSLQLSLATWGAHINEQTSRKIYQEKDTSTLPHSTNPTLNNFILGSFSFQCR